MGVVSLLENKHRPSTEGPRYTVISQFVFAIPNSFWFPLPLPVAMSPVPAATPALPAWCSAGSTWHGQHQEPSPQKPGWRCGRNHSSPGAFGLKSGYTNRNKRGCVRWAGARRKRTALGACLCTAFTSSAHLAFCFHSLPRFCPPGAFFFPFIWPFYLSAPGSKAHAVSALWLWAVSHTGWL